MYSAAVRPTERLFTSSGWTQTHERVARHIRIYSLSQNVYPSQHNQAQKNDVRVFKGTVSVLLKRQDKPNRNVLFVIYLFR